MRSGLVLRVADRTRLDVKLELGQASQTVEVRGGASLLQTAGGEVSHVVEQEKLDALPLDGRNFIPLIALAPGVALPGGGSLLPRINGSRPRTNEYLYDGVSVLQPEPGQTAWYPILDAIEEFKLDINSYSPEYGRSNGGAVIVTSPTARTSSTCAWTITAASANASSPVTPTCATRTRPSRRSPTAAAA